MWHVATPPWAWQDSTPVGGGSRHQMGQADTSLWFCHTSSRTRPTQSGFQACADIVPEEKSSAPASLLRSLHSDRNKQSHF